MNIHGASLFPGLDGFGRSIGVNLDISLAQQSEALQKANIDDWNAVLDLLDRPE